MCALGPVCRFTPLLHDPEGPVLGSGPRQTWQELSGTAPTLLRPPSPSPPVPGVPKALIPSVYHVQRPLRAISCSFPNQGLHGQPVSPPDFFSSREAKTKLLATSSPCCVSFHFPPAVTLNSLQGLYRALGLRPLPQPDFGGRLRTPTMCLEKGATLGQWSSWLPCKLCPQDSRAWGLGAGGKADRGSPASRRAVLPASQQAEVWKLFPNLSGEAVVGTNS